MATAVDVDLDALIARNPATGSEIARIPTTRADDLAGIVARAHEAQADWGLRPWPERRRVLRRWWGAVRDDAEGMVDAIVAEIGRPRMEAWSEVINTLAHFRWLDRNAGAALRGERVGPAWMRLPGLGSARLGWVPFGVIGKLGTWNYPLFLNVPPIAAALAAGNAVVWKPSEVASEVGRRIAATAAAAGLPEGLLATVYGGPEVGRALIAAEIDKGMFTGGTGGGHAIMGDLGRRGLPALAELSGFDPAVVLPDAPIGPASRAIAWAAFLGCGQTCVAIKRVYVVGDPEPWAAAIAEVARSLRVGDPTADEVDLGPMIHREARAKFHRTITAAVAAGARVVCGAEERSGAGAFYEPTVLRTDDDAPERILSGCFGPIVAVRGVGSVDEAVRAANDDPFGLAASVWGRDRRTAHAVASRLEAGSVAINEAVLQVGLSDLPFGGMKASGVGRVHGVLGLREFAQSRVIYERPIGNLRPQIFPYRERLLPALKTAARWLRPRKG